MKECKDFLRWIRFSGKQPKSIGLWELSSGLSEERTLFQLVFTSEWLEFMPGNSLLNWSISADFFGSFLLLLLLEAMMRVIPTSVELRLKASHHLLLPVFAPQFALKALFLLPPDSRNCGSHCKMPQSKINTLSYVPELDSSQ